MTQKDKQLQNGNMFISPSGPSGSKGEMNHSTSVSNTGAANDKLDDISNFFEKQLQKWELARTNFAGLKTVKTKSFSFGDFEIRVQFNPARIVSSGAKVDAKTIAERPCFLCSTNLPPEQISIKAGDYSVLVNPFPIFPEHFTIPYKNHVPQQIKPYFSDLLDLAKSMDKYVVFYNGPKCGASAPDHLHFQAGTKNFLPLIDDYKRLRDTHVKLKEVSGESRLYSFGNYLRTVFCIESNEKNALVVHFNALYDQLKAENAEEPLMNIVASYENDKWYVFVLPRKAFRPWQYTATDDRQLLVSPATVEMCGIFITPIESHFEKITKEDIQNILEQVG